MSLCDDLDREDGVGEYAPKTEPKRSNGGNGNGDESPFKVANALDPSDVLSFVGVTVDGKRLTCPSCGATSGCDVLQGGWKCLHASCADKGRDGFRTNVDTVAELRGVTPTEAVNLLAERFGFRGVQPKTERTHYREQGPAHAKNDTTEPFELVPLASLLQPAIDRATARRDGTERPIAVAHPERCECLGGGLWEGLHFVISGTGAGKSQLVIEDLLHAAKQGVPCLYIGLELDGFQVALRFLAEESRVPWSRLYKGTASEKQVELATGAIGTVEGLPIYADFAGPAGWPMYRLRLAVEAMRKAHPEGPILVVLDYLQLVAAAQGDRRTELRERIGQAAYLGRALAVEYHAAIVLVSSTARNNYGALSGDAVTSAGITMEPGTVEHGPRKVVLNPDVLVGAGKEAGEIEAAADSVTVLLKWPALLDGERLVLAVVAKGRATGASWCALAFERGQRFVPFAVSSMDDLPEAATKGGRKPITEDDIESRIVSTVRNHPNLRTASQVYDVCKGTKSLVLATVKRMVAEGRLVLEPAPAGFVVRFEEGEPNP